MSFGPPPPARPKNPPAPISSQLGLGVGLSLNGATFGAKKEHEGSSAASQSGPSVSPTPPAQQPNHTNTNFSAKGSPQGKLRYGATGPPSNRQGRLQGSTTQEDLSSDDGNDDEGAVRVQAATTLTAPSTAPSASRFRESLQDVVSTNRRVNTPPPFVTSNTTAQILHRNTTSAPSSTAAQGNTDACVSASSSNLAARYRSKTGRPEPTPTPDGANHPPSPTNAYDDGLEQLLSAVSATNDELLNVLDTDTRRAQSSAGRYAGEEGVAEGADEELPDASKQHELFDTSDFDEDGDDYVRTSTASSMWSVATSSASAFSRRSSAAMWWRSRGAKRGAQQAQGTSAANNEGVGPSSSSFAVTDSTASSFLSRSLSVAAVSRIQGTLAAPMKGETQGVAPNSGAPSASSAPPNANPFQLNAPLSSDIPLTADGTAIALTKADIANIKDEETLKFLADNSRWLAKYIVERERQQSESSPQPGGESLTSPPTLNSTFMTAVDTTGKEYSIAVVEPHESQTLAKGGAAGQHPPVLEIPLELIDFDVAEDYYAEREEPEESTVQVGDTPRSSAPDRTTLFSHERDADLVLSELLLEERGDGDLLLNAANAVNNDVSDEDQMVQLLLAANISDELAHATDQTVGLGRVGGGMPTLVGAVPTPSPSEPAMSDDIDEKAIAARVDADKIRARMRSQRTFLTSTHQQVGASINGPVGGIGVASSVGSSVASSLLKSHMGVTKEKIDELRTMREFALAKRLEMLEVKMAEGQRKRQAELDELQQVLETASDGEPSKEAKPANTTTSKFGVKYAGKKGGPPRRPPAQQATSSVEQVPANPYILMAQRLQRQLDDHRRVKLEQAQHQQKGSELTSPSTTALLRGEGFDESLLNQSSASASTTSFANAAAQLGLARAAAKAKGHLLTDDESARVDALLSFDGLWGAVGGPSTPKVDPSGLVSEPSMNADSAQSLEDHLASILGDGYAQTAKDRQRSAAIDERLQKLQMVREQLAFNHFGVGGDDGSTSGASAASATNHALSNDASLVGLAKVDTALLSANVSALLQRLQQQHDRKWQQQQADLLQQSLAGGGASSAATTAQSPVAPPSVADDPRSLEQIADAKLDSQRRRLGNLYLKEAAEAKLQRAYLKQLNAELDRIYAQNESLESDPTFAVARKYDLHQDPNALAFPTGVQPVSDDQLQRLLGSARAEEELMRPLSEEEERSKGPEGHVSTAGGANMAAKSATLGAVTLAPPAVTTPFQDALRNRLAKAQQMVEEEAVLDAQRHKEEQEAANRANNDDSQEDEGAEAAAAQKAVVA